MVTKTSKEKTTKKAAGRAKASAAGKAGAAAGAKSSKKRAPAAAKKSGASRAGGGAAASDNFSTAKTGKNGLRSFAFHRQDKGASPIMAAIRPKVGPVRAAAFGARAGAAPPAARAAASANLASLDSETAARHYLNNALESAQLSAFTANEVSGEKSEFKLISTESVPLTGNQTVKFCQHYRRTPVYGSLVMIELDKKNELVAINSALSEPSNVDPVASVSPADALKRVRERAGYVSQHLDATPRLYYFFDRPAKRWRLVYIMRDVVKLRRDEAAPPAGDAAADAPSRFAQSRRAPQVFDYVVDAHTGEIVSELPRMQSLSEQALDALGQQRTFNCAAASSSKRLHDPDLNIHTYDFRYRNVDTNESKLPGDYVANPPTPWDGAAVSAHANSAEVLVFLKQVLKRDGLDNMGGELRSTINCVEKSNTKVWDNATWYLGQVMYGQSRVNGGYRSWAAAKDIVAHEIVHGLTEKTARLEYVGESGALSESYSDILGVIVANFDQPNVAKWNWLIGKDLTADGTPLRDMKNPKQQQQPAHMDDYEVWPKTEEGDWGGVHTNSGIHNKAAYNILTAKGANGKYLFKPREVAALFYLALTQHLSRTSRFSDSRRGVEMAARSLFAGQASQKAKLNAVSRAFDKVGIVSEDE